MIKNCLCPDSGSWNALLDGRLTDPELGRMTAHLEECAACQQMLERLTVGEANWPEAARALEQRPKPALRQAMARLKAEGEAGLETLSLATVGDVSLSFLR